MEKAKEFHGHLGPFLVLGLRLGEEALKRLGAQKYFNLKAIVFAPITPPERCMADGIQLSTGCTFGKDNIELIPSRYLGLALQGKEGTVRLQVRDSLLHRIKEWLRTEGEEKAVSKLLTLPIEEILLPPNEQENRK